MGSGFESQGAHIKENPADSSESAGFLRSLNFIDFGLRYRYFPLLWCSMLGRRYSPSFLQGTRPRFASDTLMSLRAIPSFSLGYLVLRQGIYAPLCVSVFGVRCGPAGVAVDTRWFSMCAPCLANCGGGGCRGLACCVVAGVLCAGRGRAVAVWSATWRLNVGAGAPCFPEAPSGCHTDALPSEARRGGASG